MKESRLLTYAICLMKAMFIQRINARTASVSSTAVAVTANAYNFNHDINNPYDIGCKLQRKRVECAVMIKCALADEGVEAADYGNIEVHC